MPRLPYRLLPWLILAGGLGITGLLWQHERDTAERDLRASFDFAMRDAATRIAQRMATYEQILRGVQGLFAAVGRVDAAAFRVYADTLQMGADYAGIQGLAVAYLVPGEGDRLSAPIVRMEPAVGRNLQALGYDPYADPVRRAAMDRARDSGAAAITGKVRLVTESAAEGQAGFVMYLPLYRPGAPCDAVAARRASLVGWVFAGFRMNDLMASLHGERAAGTAIRIHDGVELTEATVMFDSGDALPRPRLEAVEYIDFAGRSWSLVFRSQPALEARFGRSKPQIVAFAGVGLSLLAALLVWLLVGGHDRAVALATKMTAELREREERMRHMAQHDTLTRLPNRALFSDRLSLAIAAARRHDERLALMFLDLDGFKPVNDTYGHAVGDLLLQVVAARLQACLRESDTAGRMGGDEFVVLLPAVAASRDALGVAEKICAALAEPFTVGGQVLHISASIGVAVFPENGEDEIHLAKSADDAMYRAKEAGRNRVAAAQ